MCHYSSVLKADFESLVIEGFMRKVWVFNDEFVEKKESVGEVFELLIQWL